MIADTLRPVETASASTSRLAADSGEHSTKQPSVLLVAASPRYVGGQSVMAQRLLADLRRDGVTVAFLPVDPAAPKALGLLDQIKYIRTLLRSCLYGLNLLLQVPKYDVIHVFSASYSSFLVSAAPALVVARLFGKASILNYRSGEAEDHLQRSGRITKWLIGLATCIVVPSGYLVEIFDRFGFAAKEIPNHLDTSFITYRERRSIRPHILVARTLEPLYNIPCALRAFQILQEKVPNAALTVLGDGSQRRDLERLAAELRLSNVTFTGRVERVDIARHFHEADLFLNTSSIDNMPVSIIEAFAAGLPIVTTNAGGIPFLIADRINGHLVSIDDHAAVAERLIELVENQNEVYRLSRLGCQEIKKYTWEVAGPRWTSLYRKLSAYEGQPGSPDARVHTARNAPAGL